MKPTGRSVPLADAVSGSSDRSENGTDKNFEQAREAEQCGSPLRSLDVKVVVVSPGIDESDDAFKVTARSLDECAIPYASATKSDALVHVVDPTLDESGGLLLVRAGVRFLREPSSEDFVSPVTGEHYLFSDYPEDWFPLASSPKPRACEQLLFLDRSALTYLPQADISLGELLTTGYLHLQSGGQQFIWREPLIRALTSQRESDALIVTDIDEDSQRWGYLGVWSQAPPSGTKENISNRNKTQALRRLTSRRELLRALMIRFKLVVLVKKEPYYRFRKRVGAVMLQVPVLRRFVQTG